MNARTQAIAYRFVLGLLLVEIPVISAYLTSSPRQDWPILFAGLLGGLAGAITKYLEPQIVSIGSPEPGDKPTIVGVSLKDVSPAPPQISGMQTARPTVEDLDAMGADKIKQ